MPYSPRARMNVLNTAIIQHTRYKGGLEFDLLESIVSLIQDSVYLSVRSESTNPEEFGKYDKQQQQKTQQIEKSLRSRKINFDTIKDNLVEFREEEKVFLNNLLFDTVDEESRDRFLKSNLIPENYKSLIKEKIITPKEKIITPKTNPLDIPKILYCGKPYADQLHERMAYREFANAYNEEVLVDLSDDQPSSPPPSPNDLFFGPMEGKFVRQKLVSKSQEQKIGPHPSVVLSDESASRSIEEHSSVESTISDLYKHCFGDSSIPGGGSQGSVSSGSPEIKSTPSPTASLKTSSPKASRSGKTDGARDR